VDYTSKFFKNNTVFRPMAETEYFKWLMSNKFEDINAIFTKSKFLSEVYGFVKGVDRISPDALKSMKAIEVFYYDFYVLKKGKYATTRDVY
jgi:hypothetical protein